jgi:2-keto-3-deoxy-L-rhamnonate aldolase RhmA
MSAASDLKVRLARGESAVGLLLAYDAPWLIEVAALTGCEYVVVDLEHEAIADDRVVELTRAAEVHGIPLLVRMPLSPRLTPFLSAGIAGVWVPHLRGRAHAEEIVAETRFRPLGRRTYYTQTRGARFGFGIDEANWTQQANEELIVIAMLEDEAVVSELAGVLAVDGIDGFHVGTLDLAESMGQPPKEQVEEVVARAVSQCRAAGKPIGVGILTPSNLDTIANRRSQGIQLFTVASARVLTAAVESFFADARRAIQDAG